MRPKRKLSLREIADTPRQASAPAGDCTTCICPVSYSGLSVVPEPSFDAAVGGSEQAPSTGDYEDCNSTFYYYDETTASTWNSGNTSVFTMSTTTKGLANAVEAGSSTISAAYTGELWYYYSLEARCLYNSIPCSVGTTGNAGAHPVNFHMTGSSDQGGGVVPMLQAVFAWQSSSGSLNDLSSCSMRENVTYPSTSDSACPNNNPPGSCYYPPSPPWPVPGQGGTGYPNPTQVSGAASSGGFEDDNVITNLNFVKPYSANSFSATQYYQYTCNGGPWTNIYGPTTITRSVFQNSQGKWAVRVSRSDTSATSTYVIPGQ